MGTETHPEKRIPQNTELKQKKNWHVIIKCSITVLYSHVQFSCDFGTNEKKTQQNFKNNNLSEKL